MKLRYPILGILLSIPIASAAGPGIATYVTVVLGIFSALTFTIVSFILKKNEQSIGPWILLGLACIMLTLYEYFKYSDILYKQAMMTSGMVLIFFVALFKFWDTMEIIQ